MTTELWESLAIEDLAAKRFPTAGVTYLVQALSDGYRASDAYGRTIYSESDINHAERAIQAAIDALPSGGGSIILSSGNFYISSGLTSDKPITIVGEGSGEAAYALDATGVTVLRLNDNVNVDMLTISNVTGVQIRSIKMFGNYDNNATGGSGIVLDTCRDVRLTDIVIRSFREYGINSLGGADHFYHNIVAAENRKQGFRVYSTTDGRMSNCIAMGNGSGTGTGIYGFSFSSAFTWVLTNCIADSNYSSPDAEYAGFNIDSSQRIILTGCQSFKNGAMGVRIVASSDVIINGAIIMTNGAKTTSKPWGIYLSGSDNIIIVGSVISNLTGYTDQLWGIHETNTCNNNLFIGNQVYGNTNGQINSSGTGTIIRNNHGYITENSGTATIPNGSTSVKVTHGLAAVPTRVQITLTSSLGNATEIYVSDKDIDGDGTKFQVSVDADPGADVTFDWRAVVGEGN